jgi:hypothetical protein
VAGGVSINVCPPDPAARAWSGGVVDLVLVASSREIIWREKHRHREHPIETMAMAVAEEPHAMHGRSTILPIPVK